MAEQQVVPARHGTATFVPAGQSIKIINTSGTQVVDTWAFALPSPPEREQSAEEKGQEKKEDAKQSTPQKKTPAKKGADLPSQEDAEKATQEGMKAGEQEAQNAGQQKSTWSSYVPSLGWSSAKKDQGSKGDGGETQQQKNSRTWASYFPSGKGYSSYIPKTATDTVSSFAASVCVIQLRSEITNLTAAPAPTRPQQILHGTTARLLAHPRGRSRLDR